MRIYLKHPKPDLQTPSKYFIENIENTSIPPCSVLDLACGYGRNGAYLAQRKHHVIFADIDQDCLNFISKGENVAENGDIPKEYYKTINVDLLESWPFKPSSLGGIICVHFYFPSLILKCIDSIVPGGFIYIETIDARVSNYLALPFQNEILNQLKPTFNIKFHRENIVKSILPVKSACSIFAIKNYQGRCL